jgi:hypothetical protein
MRTLLLLAQLCCLTHLAAAQTGTYYDTSTGEYLTLDHSNGPLVISYSNGTRPFAPLLLIDTEESSAGDGPSSEASKKYRVAFKSSPKTTYLLTYYPTERSGIDCEDAAGQLLNQYSFISSAIFEKPDYLRILYAIGPSFATDDEPVSLNFGYSDIALVVMLTLPEGERELRVKSLLPKENKIIFTDAAGGGPYELTLFEGIKYRTPGLANDVLYLQAPGKAIITLHN